MQGLKEKQKNMKNWGLFAVCMHTAKDHLVTLLCAYTQQRTHVELTCAFGEGFRSIENKKIPTMTNKNKPRSDLRDAKQ
jgi:hypothetical protein